MSGTETALATLRAAVPNVRDAGGRSTASGGRMRRGVVYRSAQLLDLSADAQDALLALGVRTVHDLRTADEIAHRRDTLPEGITLVVDDVLADRPHSGAAGVASIVNQHADRASVSELNAAVGGGRAADVMRETYRHLVTLPSAHRGYRRLLSGIANGDDATVIHCTAGKDRSGWAVALLQLVCGVSRDDVMADYLLSNDAMAAAYGPMLEAFAREGGDADALAHMIYVEPGYLETALAVVDEEFGGLDGYLATGLGTSGADVDRLRTRLLR